MEDSDPISYEHLNCLDIPSMDMAFLSNNVDLGLGNDTSSTNFDFDNIDFSLDLDDIDFGSDELQQQSSSSSSLVFDNTNYGCNLNSDLSDSRDFVSGVLVMEDEVLESNSGNFDQSNHGVEGEERVLNVLAPENLGNFDQNYGNNHGGGEKVLESNSPNSGNSGNFDQNNHGNCNGEERVLDVLSPESGNSGGGEERVSESGNSGNFDQKYYGNDGGKDGVLDVLSTESGNSGGGDRSVSGPASSHFSGGGDMSVIGEVLSSLSTESGVVSESGSASPNSCTAQSDVVYQEVKVEEEGKGCVLKRKKDDDDDDDENVGNSNSSISSNPRSSKVRKATVTVSVEDSVVPPEEDKKKARLMRNRESAQLSRQRKKHYVEELEDKVRSMAAVIADLNGRVSYFMSENANLRQQLNHGAVPPQPGVYPPPAMAPMPYPWYPPAPYTMRTQGSQVPLVPIPRLKPKQPTSVSKSKKSDSKKTDSKVKKVPSVTFLGLLFFVFLFCGLVPLLNVRYGGKMDMYSGDFGFGTNGFHSQRHGRVLTVSDHLNDSHSGVEVGYQSEKSNLRECGANRINCRRAWVEGGDSKGKHGSQRRNSSEPLVASLYVPRNDKLVKIDGNLIIHSVLASERAMASRTTSEKKTVSPANESPETSLVIAGHPHMYRGPSVRQKALNSGSSDSYKDRQQSPASDGSLQKWFQEGLAGPILSSGMCTEVFQFDVSSSINPGAIIPASSVNISTVKNDSQTSQPTKRNRRSLNHLPIPLPNEFNHSEEHSRIPPHKNKTVSSMVVSILADPREAGDIDLDGGISPKSLSKIFVVVLIDSVKYVTYSCMLPFKGASPSHLVTT